nr:GntR family transcriptional regulator [Cellulosimicrobium arenosum]
MPDDAPSLRESVYTRLRADILDGRVDARERLTEPRLSREFEVSRTPVREALSRLLSDGLVVRTDFGYAVVVPTLVELSDLYELRLRLELAGVDRVLENRDVRYDTQALAAELSHWVALGQDPPEPEPDLVLLDEHFHAVLSRAAGNARTTAALVEVHEKIRAVRRHDVVDAARLVATIAEHVEILELVLDERLPEARSRLRAHLGESLAGVGERAGRALSRQALAATPLRRLR